VTERVLWGGRYALFGEIAAGGMATVYLAARLDKSSEIPPVVALKKLSEQLAKQPEFVAMFLDEAHLASRIRHPNVVTTYEFLRTGEGLGIVMDLVVGESFMALLRGAAADVEPAPLLVSTAILVGALEGLHAAHEVCDDTGRPLGLIHRDMSPHNILVGADGIAQVIDFGIAKAAGRLQTTDVGIIKGKFAYMSPEQIHGAELDRATDIYSAGIVLWEALVGRQLFRASSNQELLTKRSAGVASIPPPHLLNPGVPAALERIVLRALANDAKDRYATAAKRARSSTSSTQGAARSSRRWPRRWPKGPAPRPHRGAPSSARSSCSPTDRMKATPERSTSKARCRAPWAPARGPHKRRRRARRGRLRRPSPPSAFVPVCARRGHARWGGSLGSSRWPFSSRSEPAASCAPRRCSRIARSSPPPNGGSC